MMSSAMPVAGVTAMLRMTAPQKAVGILLSMPNDRIRAVLTAMAPPDAIRILGATTPDRAAALLSNVDPDRISPILLTMAVGPAATLLAAMPAERVSAIIATMPGERAQDLLAALRPVSALPMAPASEPPRALPVEMQPAMPAAAPMPRSAGPQPVAAQPAYPQMARRIQDPPQRPVLVPRPLHPVEADWLPYERGVVRALESTAAQIVPAGDELRHCVLVKCFGWLIAVTIHYREFGTLTLSDLYAAEETASRATANAALTVTNTSLTKDAQRYNDDARAEGRPVAAVTWTDARDNGRLQRALVRLVR